MSYIKLYESFDKVFYELSDAEWKEFIKEIESFNLERLKNLPDIKFDVRKTFQKSDLIKYITTNVHDVIVFIYEKSDEYYGIYAEITNQSTKRYNINKKFIKLKCDQIEGLISGLEFIEQTIASYKVQNIVNSTKR